jgi:hypothetical protein
MAEFGQEGEPEPLIPKISQETLAEMIGTTRSRVPAFKKGCQACYSVGSC